MAQGKEWTTEEKDKIIQSLQPYLEMGFSRNKACELIGLASSTLSNWVNQDDSLGIKLKGWENMINALAISNIKSAIRKESELPDDLRKENSWKWAERRIKELSPKSEQEHNFNTPNPILVKFIGNGEDNRDTNRI